MACVIRFPRRWTGDLNHRHFVAHTRPSSLTGRKCTMCGGQVRRSWRTGILHPRCRSCRYLVMMYGPSIEVTFVKREDN